LSEVLEGSGVLLLFMAVQPDALVLFADNAHIVSRSLATRTGVIGVWYENPRRNKWT
jgi:hypothetical protein